MGPRHQGTTWAEKFSLRQVANTNWFGGGGQGFSRLRLPYPCPFCVSLGPLSIIVPDPVPQMTVKYLT